MTDRRPGHSSGPWAAQAIDARGADGTAAADATSPGRPLFSLPSHLPYLPSVSPVSQVEEYTSAKAGCASRSLGCFFQPISPDCDAALAGGDTNRSSAAAPRPKVERSRSHFFVRKEARGSNSIPAAFAARGWFWWVAHLLRHMLRPADKLARAVAEAGAASGLTAQLAKPGATVVGMHVRHGDACTAAEVVRSRRSCSPLAEYVGAARRLLATRRGAGPLVVYLATDSAQVVREAQAYRDITFVYLRTVGRHDPRAGREPVLWDRRASRLFLPPLSPPLYLPLSISPSLSPL